MENDVAFDAMMDEIQEDMGRDDASHSLSTSEELPGAEEQFSVPSHDLSFETLASMPAAPHSTMQSNDLENPSFKTQPSMQLYEGMRPSQLAGNAILPDNLMANMPMRHRNMLYRASQSALHAVQALMVLQSCMPPVSHPAQPLLHHHNTLANMAVPQPPRHAAPARSATDNASIDAKTGQLWLEYREHNADRKLVRKRLPLIRHGCWGFVNACLNPSLARQVPITDSPSPAKTQSKAKAKRTAKISAKTQTQADEGIRLAMPDQSLLRITLPATDIFVCGRLIPPKEPSVEAWPLLAEKQVQHPGVTALLALPTRSHGRLGVDLERHGQCGYRIGVVVRNEAGQAYWRVSARTFDFVHERYFDASILELQPNERRTDMVENRTEDEESSVQSSSTGTSLSNRGVLMDTIPGAAIQAMPPRSSGDDGTGSESSASSPPSSHSNPTGSSTRPSSSSTAASEPFRANDATVLQQASAQVHDWVEPAVALYHPSRGGKLPVGTTTNLCLLVGQGAKAKRSAARVKISTQADVMVTLSTLFPPPVAVLLVAPYGGAIAALIPSPAHVSARVAHGMGVSPYWSGVYRLTASADNKFPFGVREHGEHGYRLALRFAASDLLPSLEQANKAMVKSTQLLASGHADCSVVDVVLGATQIQLTRVDRLRTRRKQGSDYSSSSSSSTNGTSTSSNTNSSTSSSSSRSSKTRTRSKRSARHDLLPVAPEAKQSKLSPL